ncbi:PEP/pyruvate-binding domain-containing protein [Paenibacillus herberti]|nr:PEP/pyruvate-binding domain-containing protein [Paenibacillus herberti]
MIKRLDGLYEIDVGGKANALNKLAAHCIPIPRGFIVPFDMLMMRIEASGQYEEFFRATQGDLILYRSSTLREIIESLVPDDRTKRWLIQVCEELSPTLIVRSSADNEDTNSSSMAGIYESCTVQSTWYDLWRGIKDCWLSAYSNKVLTLLGDYPKKIHLLIQEFIHFDHSGIAFSSYRDGDNKSGIRVEMVEGDCSLLVDGLVEPHTYLLDRDKEPAADDKMSAEILCELRNLLLELERIMGCSVDVEWGVREGQLYITQCRPITRNRTVASPKHAAWYEEEEVYVLLHTHEHFSCKTTIEHHLNKKYWARLILKRNQIRPSAIGFFCYEKQQLTMADVQALQQRIRTELLEIRIDEGYYRMPSEADKLYERLQAIGEDHSLTVVCISEFPQPEKSGYSKQIGNRIIIETINGGFNGMWKDGQIPSRYEVTLDGEIALQEVYSIPYKYEFDMRLLRWNKKWYQTPVPCEVTEDEIWQIVQMTKVLEDSLGNVSVEWTAFNGQLTYFDLSKEHNDLLTNSGSVVSNGIGRGRCRRIESDRLDELFDSIHEINIIPTEAYIYIKSFPQNLYAVSEFPHQNAVLEQVKDDDEYHKYLRTSNYLLSPAVCFHCYEELKNSTLNEPLLLTSVGTCFRHEAYWRLGEHRLNEFKMREIVFVGTPEYVEYIRNLIMEDIWEMFKRLGFSGKIETAHDPFYFPKDAVKQQYQLMSNMKYELVVNIKQKESSFSIASFNNVKDTLCKEFRIVDENNLFLHSGCVAFGIDRWVYAILALYGTDPYQWPESLLKELEMQRWERSRTFPCR